MHCLNSYCLHTVKEICLWWTEATLKSTGFMFHMWFLCFLKLFSWGFFVFWLFSHWTINSPWITAPITHLTIPEGSKTEFVLYQFIYSICSIETVISIAASCSKSPTCISTAKLPVAFLDSTETGNWTKD